MSEKPQEGENIEQQNKKEKSNENKVVADEIENEIAEEQSKDIEDAKSGSQKNSVSAEQEEAKKDGNPEDTEDDVEYVDDELLEQME